MPPLNATVPCAPCVKPVTVSGSLFGSLSFASTFTVPAVLMFVVSTSSTAFGTPACCTVNEFVTPRLSCETVSPSARTTTVARHDPDVGGTYVCGTVVDHGSFDQIDVVLGRTQN